ncbi:hypothetical protein Taro_003386, partial [Colocasia esculenta]|nr:hypothetical protein [Colocasia esculenta]
MSTLVLGKRSSSCFFEELQHHPAAGAATTPPPTSSASKRARFAASPLRLSHSLSLASSPLPCLPEFSSSHAPAGASDISSKNRATSPGHLRSLYPHIDEQVLERALEASSNDLDSAINSLDHVCVESTMEHLQSAADILVEDICAVSQPFAEAVNNLPAGVNEWVDLFVREMMDATEISEARSRASKVLQVLEKSVINRTSAEVTQSFCK